MTSSNFSPVATTALDVTYFRYRETQRATGGLIRDPYSAQILEAFGHTVDYPPEQETKITSAIAIRTHYIDTAIRQALAHGASPAQVVIVGAGFDTRAARLDLLANGHAVFEIDLPEIIGAKKEIFNASNEALPTFGTGDWHAIAANLAGEDPWWEALATHGLRPQRPTIWVVEGLFYYLPPAAAAHMLSCFSTAAPAAILIADHMGPASRNGTRNRAATERLDRLGTRLTSAIASPTEFLADSHWICVHASTIAQYGANIGRPLHYTESTGNEAAWLFTARAEVDQA